jgi:translin
MVKKTTNLDIIAERIRVNFMAKDAARERILPLSREVIRYCSTAIRALHRQEFADANRKLKTARELLDEMDKVI